MDTRKILYLLALCIALQPSAADALFEKWSTRRILSLSSVVITTAALVSLYLYRNWSRKKTANNPPTVVNKSQSNFKTNVVNEKKNDSQPKKNVVEEADIRLQNLISASNVEPVLHEEATNGLGLSTYGRASQEDYVAFILFKLNTIKNQADLKKFVNVFRYVSAIDRGSLEINPIACEDAKRGRTTLFVRLLKYNYYHALNLLLSTGLLETTGQYGMGVESNGSVTPTNSFLGYLMRFMYYPFNSKFNSKVLVDVLCSHGAKTFNNKKEVVRSENKENVYRASGLDRYKKLITIEPTKTKPKEKLFFSANGTSAVTKDKFVEELTAFLSES